MRESIYKIPYEDLIAEAQPPVTFHEASAGIIVRENDNLGELTDIGVIISLGGVSLLFGALYWATESKRSHGHRKPKSDRDDPNI